MRLDIGRRNEKMEQTLIRNNTGSTLKIGVVKRGVWQVPGRGKIKFLRFGFNMPGEEVYFGELTKDSAKVDSTSLLLVKNEGSPEISLFGFRTYDWSDGRFVLEPSEKGFQVTALADYDHYRLAPGESAGVDDTIVLKGNSFNALLNEWAELVAGHAGRRIPAVIPTGWNDWQYYRNEKTAQDIMESCDALKRLKEQGWDLQFVQVDGGYALHLSEWHIPKDGFGMTIGELSEHVRKAGFKFGLWFAPYIQNLKTKVVKEHPDWFLVDENGALVRLDNSNVGPSALIDYTVPGTQDWLREQIRFLVEEWHVEWIKLDGPNITTYRRGVLRDPHCTVQQMMRRTFEIIREAAGNVLVEGEGSMTAAAGLVDLHRVQTDTRMAWYNKNDRSKPYLPRVYGKELIMSFLHKVWWCNHRENIILRDYPSPFAMETERDPNQVEQLFTANERRTQLVSAMISPGGLLLTDPMKELICRSELLEDASHLFPPAEGRTQILDPFPEDGGLYPHWYYLDAGFKKYLAVVNWGDVSREYFIPDDFRKCKKHSLFSGHKSIGSSLWLGAHDSELMVLEDF